MHVNRKKKGEKGMIAGRVAGAARLGRCIGCLTVCCMMCLMICLMVGFASAAEPGKIKVKLDFTKINKALEEASTPSSNRSSGSSSYTVAPSPRISSTTGGSASTASTAGTGKTKVKLDFTKINKALGEASTPSSNRSTTTSDTTSNTMGGMTGMANAMASSMAGSMAPAMTGATPSTSSKSTSKNTSGNTPSAGIMGIQMDSEMTKIISETRNEMMKSIMQGMFSNTSMMANMQKKVMSDNMPKSSSQGGSSPSGSMNSSGK